jgi:hypothetical protein
MELCKAGQSLIKLRNKIKCQGFVIVTGSDSHHLAGTGSFDAENIRRSSDQFFN